MELLREGKYWFSTMLLLAAVLTLAGMYFGAIGFLVVWALVGLAALPVDPRPLIDVEDIYIVLVIGPFALATGVQNRFDPQVKLCDYTF